MKRSVNLFLCAALASTSFAVEKRKIDFVVGVDGDFKAAIAAAGSSGASASKQFVIFLPDGEYELTKLTADSHGKTTVSASFVSIIGQSLEKTVISNKTDTESIGHTATLYFTKNNGVYMQDITLQNKSTFCGQNACRQVALQQNEGDKFTFKNVRLLSGQDTYYSKKGRTYWEGGEIDGTVDFICGGGNVFFEGTKLVMTRKGGYITASQSDSDWGYVFNNAIIDVSDNSFNKTFYLGRSWARAKTVFLNTIMKAEPTAEGWGPDMNSAPQVFGEYNSKNANGGAINTSQRKTRFDGGKDGSTATTLKTVWDANDAAKYTLSNVLKGSDNWDPTKLTAQVNAPKIAQEGAEITWNNDDNARCWVIFVNGKYKANVITPSFSLDGIATGSKITVRAANSMGGLGASSNEVTTLDATATYYKVSLNEPVGGTVETSFSGDKVMEGKDAVFTAKPFSGWKFAGWSGASAAGIDASKSPATIKATGDIELAASFVGDGTNKFQAEDGTVENAIKESSNAGFAGTGYINFGTGVSTVTVPVYASAKGEYKLTMTYANGSTAARSLSIKGESGEPQEIEFATTENWTTYEKKDVSVTLPLGASTITFATVGGNDGPNLDQLELTAVNVTPPDTGITRIASEVSGVSMNASTTRVRLFSMTGKLLRESADVNTAGNAAGLPRGIYILQIRNGSITSQKIIQVK
ncbi:pectinesterase family protein [uncultured Fibrobacter sp.]|uniref:pectinesterase family protein n=1 Tax=uncultured Fibrobacter sp. TaxID=261512 RepID=UPI0025E8B53F|nr:pectinesterase family protein [uncultured Fibrobacter sp.]